MNYIGRRYGEELSGHAKADWLYNFVFNDTIATKKFAEIINNGVIDDKSGQHNFARSLAPTFQDVPSFAATERS